MMPRRNLRANDERGFALVGVIMLVLALTILGLSLFSLSSYESQFLRRSLDSELAFQAATSGVETAKFQLTKSGLLEMSNWGFPASGVDSVIATQLVGGTLHRSGAVTSGIPVHIQSYGRVRDASVETGGDYDIQSTYDYYRRLLSIQGPVAAVPVAGTMRITGYAWQQGGSTLWKNFVTWDVNPDSLNTTVTVPTPAVGPIITGHSGAPDPPSSGFPNVTYTLDAGGSTPKFFYTNSGFELSLNTALNTTIKVSGPVVWCFPRGVALQGVVKVEPFGSQPNTSLTIIAGHTLFPGYVGYGIWFNNGVDSPLVPLVLVSDGSTRLIQQYEIFNKSIPYLSVFSKSLLLEGPPVFGTTWHLTHTPGSPHDQPGGLIDILATAGALPNATVSGAKYTLRKGTWQTAAN